MRTREAIDRAMTEVADVTGMPVETVSGLERDGDGQWIVTVEVLELQRVPSTMDVLASYEVTMSDGGELVGFQRRRRYNRSAAEGGRG